MKGFSLKAFLKHRAFKIHWDDCQLDDQLEDAILEEEKYDFEPGNAEMENEDLTIEDFSDTEDYEYYYGHGKYLIIK